MTPPNAVSAALKPLRTGTKNPHTLYRGDEPLGFVIDPAEGQRIVKLEADLLALQKEKDDLMRALRNIAAFRAHFKSCEIDQTDFCICGMQRAADEAKAALERAR